MIRLPAVLAITATILLVGCSEMDPGGLAGPEPEPDPTGPSDAIGSFDVVGRGPVTGTHTSDIWVFEGVDGRDYAYTGTWGGCSGCFGDRLYIWDVTTPAAPLLTDSVMVDARVVNDIKVNAEGTIGVMTREGASDRKNGIVILELSDPAHPTILSVFTESLTGGVHNTYIDGNHLYAVHNGTRDLRVIDISDPAAPKMVGSWALTPNKGIFHDVWVKDGIAYLSYWNDGLVILDVGDGSAGGSPANPVQISAISYTTMFQGVTYGNTHVAFPYTNRAGRSYVFVGDEIFPSNFIDTQSSHPLGYIHVIDVTDLNSPTEVGRYEVPLAGSHNLWVEDDIMYVAYYNAGLRAVDVSGTLSGDLLSQAREIAVLSTGDDDGFIRRTPFAWGPQLFKGHVFVADHNSGLWIARLNRAGGPAN